MTIQKAVGSIYANGVKLSNVIDVDIGGAASGRVTEQCSQVGLATMRDLSKTLAKRFDKLSEAEIALFSQCTPKMIHDALFEQSYAKLQAMKKLGRVPRADFSDFPGRVAVIPMLVSVIYR